VPQETKAMPFDPETLEHAPGTAHQSREGTTAPLGNDAEVRAAVEAAFDYRGDVSLRLKDGRAFEGYIFDRRADRENLAQCTLRFTPRDASEKIIIRYSDLAHLAFTGRDAAAGKSFETWVKKYAQRKAAGEANIRLEPEKLD
jgi:hypothetical protein